MNYLALIENAKTKLKETKPLGGYVTNTENTNLIEAYLGEKFSQPKILKIEKWHNVLFVKFCHFDNPAGKYCQRFVSYKVLGENAPENKQETEQPIEQAPAPVQENAPENEQTEPAQKTTLETPILPKIKAYKTENSWKARGRGRPKMFSIEKFERILKSSFAKSKKEYGNNNTLILLILKMTVDKINEEMEGFYITGLLSTPTPEKEFHTAYNMLLTCYKLSQTGNLAAIEKLEKIKTSKKLLMVLDHLKDSEDPIEAILETNII